MFERAGKRKQAWSTEKNAAAVEYTKNGIIFKKATGSKKSSV
jgi:hypothetical protein